MHVIFWALYFSFFFYLISFPKRGEEPNYFRAFLDAIMQVTTMAAVSYFNYFVLMPRALKSRKWFLYFVQIVASLALIITLQIWFKREIYIELGDRAFNWLRSFRFVLQHTSTTIFIVTFIASLRFLQDYFELEAERKEVENQKLQSELRFLKEQINPHFLFNTLNNLYYLAHTNSPNTKDVIAKLSQMMRYMIYEATTDKVPVSREIEYIKNYIALERLRLNEGFPIEVNISGDYDTLTITPLIFITFLENAFKHGVENGDENSWVRVDIDFDSHVCTYEVSNSKPPEDKAVESESSGIGLKNTLRRLNLSYHGRHELIVDETDKKYGVKLIIELDEN
ncbi:sensor histidine kinase [Jiulongibacter sp. NS-SX5]|uniref:sensor histidine kinase n=1 Tax=Jiulongibacter sp. NS-SX5 TaxID=3463854 RepID=UPI0040581516